VGEEPEVKTMRLRTIFAALLLLPALGGIPASAASEDRSAPVIREEQQVNIDGVDETWRLQWDHTPHPRCTPASDEGWATCPCNPFAFGEAGRLSLIRLRNGVEYERLKLTGYFTEDDVKNGTEAALQKYIPLSSDYGRSTIANNEIARRPIARLMRLKDYDHDGHATEFMLPVINLVCGHELAVVVGISASNPHLHVFGSAEKPDTPLKLQPHEWTALAQRKTQVVAFRCGDHGSETEMDLALHVSKRGISVKQLHYDCLSNGKRGKLLTDAELSKLQHPPD
jgi:hypothetical protein